MKVFSKVKEAAGSVKNVAGSMKNAAGSVTSSVTNAAGSVKNVAGSVSANATKVLDNPVGNKAAGTFKEFMDFIKEYKVVGLAIAFVIGAAATTLIKSLVDNIIMPIITPFIPGGAWQTAKLIIPLWGTNAINLGWGPMLAEIINFTMIAFAVFMIAKIVLKEEKVAKK